MIIKIKEGVNNPTKLIKRRVEELLGKLNEYSCHFIFGAANTNAEIVIRV